MIKMGDVFSILTKKGLAYLQYTNKNSLMGTLVRVLPGIFSEACDDVESLVKKETNFWIFFQISAALKLGIVEKVGNFPIPEHSKNMPVFRAGIPNSKTKKVEHWWFWDGEKEWRVGEITDQQRKMPIRRIWNDTLLIQRIEEEWLPERDKF